MCELCAQQISFSMIFVLFSDFQGCGHFFAEDCFRDLFADLFSFASRKSVFSCRCSSAARSATDGWPLTEGRVMEVVHLIFAAVFSGKVLDESGGVGSSS